MRDESVVGLLDQVEAAGWPQSPAHRGRARRAAQQRTPSEATFCAASRAKIRLMAATRRGLEPAVGLLGSSYRESARAARRAKPPRVSALAMSSPRLKQHMLVTGEPADAGGFEHLSERVAGERRDVGAALG